MGKYLYKYIIFLASIVALDLFSKGLALRFGYAYGNSGFFLGSFKASSPFIRIMGLSSLCGFLLFLYLSFISFSSIKLPKLKLGLSLLMGGILSNVIDRMINGYTTDFIPLSLLNYSTHFNIADLAIILGSFFILYCLFWQEDKIWHPENLRSSFLINNREQTHFATKMLFISLVTSFYMVFFSLGFWRSIIPVHLDLIQDNFFLFCLFYLFLMSLFGVCVFLMALFLGHKTAGPLYAFEKYVERLMAGEREELKLRKGDNYQHFEKLAHRLLAFFQDYDKKN